ncbi:hypothetical protein KFL_001550170 [Klebsormidium nitens]|uniref:Uncharacterized protein n=1 Tax=Klebsormidium nitens TaxID=105231 RepID=A0A1Y1I4F7_KLENI|nr:hypothetical protein KFL_001550170 [Klebsormidium nitens]|eukprot:GAQ83627.1 hypothetical protein KFL_001550170 [Klebsormidium nitens]
MRSPTAPTIRSCAVPPARTRGCSTSHCASACPSAQRGYRSDRSSGALRMGRKTNGPGCDKEWLSGHPCFQ